jgi:Holliday junction resolvase RusA-like endonuclease
LITLVLPVPPSTNNLFVNGRRGRFKSQHYRDWLDEAGFYLMQQTYQKGLITGPYEMEIRVPMNCRADITNLMKAPEDCLVSIGVLPDDKHCRRATIERADVEDCEVTVRAV